MNMVVKIIYLAIVTIVIIALALTAFNVTNKDGTEQLGIFNRKTTTTPRPTTTTPRPTTTTPRPTTTTPIPTTTIPWTCTDTDGGRVYTIKGTVSGQTTQPFNFTDYCESSGSLREYYCRADNAPTYESHSCGGDNSTVTCVDGACV
jgi:hypothetical protein